MRLSDSQLQNSAIATEAQVSFFCSKLNVAMGDDPNRYRPGRDWLRNPYRIHQRIAMAFDGDPTQKEEELGERPGRILFRVEPPFRRIIVVSTIVPKWDEAFRNTSILLDQQEPWDVKQADFTIRRGQLLRFYLRANPVHRATEKSVGPDGEPIAAKWVRKRVPIAPSDGAMRTWLERKGERHGFTVVPDEVEVLCASMQASRRKMPETLCPDQAYECPREKAGDTMKEKQVMKHWGVDYEGVLHITCPTEFAKALICGIGPGKAFGFGLLSIAPAG